METLNTAIIDKFYGLLSFLTKTKKEFEMVADEIADGNLKVVLNGLSTESSQCANEIYMQLKSMGIPYYSSASAAVTLADDIDLNNGKEDLGDNELLRLCSNCENFITRAYKEILNEYFHLPDLRQIMNYQLDALKCSFMKIKLLNAARLN